MTPEEFAEQAAHDINLDNVSKNDRALAGLGGAITLIKVLMESGGDVKHSTLCHLWAKLSMDYIDASQRRAEGQSSEDPA